MPMLRLLFGLYNFLLVDLASKNVRSDVQCFPVLRRNIYLNNRPISPFLTSPYQINAHLMKEIPST